MTTVPLACKRKKSFNQLGDLCTALSFLGRGSVPSSDTVWSDRHRVPTLTGELECIVGLFSEDVLARHLIDHSNFRVHAYIVTVCSQTKVF